MFARIKAAIVAFVSRAAVRSVARHAITAAVAVIVADIAAGIPITTGVLIVAIGAAARVVWLAIEGKPSTP